MSITRRVWLHIVTLISLAIFATGVGQLLSLLFDNTIKSAAVQFGDATFTQRQFSLGLAMVIIGGPLWFAFWRAIQRRVQGNDEETGAGMHKFFLNLILVVTAITALNAASDFISWLLSGVPLDRFSSEWLAVLIVSGIIWGYHLRVSEGEGHPSPIARTFRRWYVYILSAFGLIWMAVAPVQLITTAVLNLPFWPGTLARGSFWNDTTQMNVSWVVLGTAAWYLHWHKMARGDFDSTLRQVYFYLLAILGGAIAALIALTVTVYQVLVWLFGAVTTPLSTHFQSIGWTIPTILVGAAIWSYHNRLSQQEAAETHELRLSAKRVHYYLMSFLGLGTLVGGLIVLFGTIIDALINAASPAVAVTPGWWQRQLSASLALLLVGVPMWLHYWNNVTRRAAEGGINEWRARSRRVFLFVVVGISILTIAADLVNIIYQSLNGALSGNFDVGVLRNSRWSLQTIIVAVPLLWYHWRIVRAEQRRGAETAAVQKTVTVIIGNQPEDFVLRLEEKLGYRIRLLHQTNLVGAVTTPVSDEEIAGLADEIRTAPGSRVLIVTVDGKTSVIPYVEK
ncbi:MAG: hypothetical protein HY662_04530 [Chloroflexi bacterium]|nr:hypothetical protein [Chloroflexota bacterium]